MTFPLFAAHKAIKTGNHFDKNFPIKKSLGSAEGFSLV